MLRVLRRLLVLAMLGAAVGAAVRALRSRQAAVPVPDAGPSWPPLSVVDPPAESEEGTGVVADVVEVVDAVAVSADAARSWMEPVEGGCPDGYLVKANRSGIFHVPGGQFYDRTVPERCYHDPQAAEADGYRPARR